jgi:hypothetical protein
MGTLARSYAGNCAAYQSGCLRLPKFLLLLGDSKMTTIDELVSQIETEITGHETREATARAEAESILNAAQAGGQEYPRPFQDRFEGLSHGSWRSVAI